MNIAEYREAVGTGLRSILSAALDWQENPLTERVNRVMWGRWPWFSLAALALVTLGLGLVVPRFERLIAMVPALIGFAYVPGLIRNLLLSAPAFFGFVVAWRVHALRATDPDVWRDRHAIPKFGSRFFDAGGLPVAIAALVVVIGLQIVGAVVPDVTVPLPTEALDDGAAGTAVSFSARAAAQYLVVIALASGILGAHRKVGKGLGQLFGAGFAVWGMHLGIGFAAPWMVSWLAFIPVIGQYAPSRSVSAAHLLLDLAVALTAWASAREKCREFPLWSDAAPPAPPPPPPPPNDSE